MMSTRNSNHHDENEIKKLLLDEYLIRTSNPVRVKVLKSEEPIHLGKRKIILKAGSEINLELWLALELEKLGYVTFPGEGLTLNDLNKIFWNEKNKNALQPLPPNFYIHASRLLNDLSKKEGSPYLLREKETLEGKLLDLKIKRLEKILKMAKSSEANPRSAKNLTNEEFILYGLLKKDISTWQKNVFKIANLMDEVMYR